MNYGLTHFFLVLFCFLIDTGSDSEFFFTLSVTPLPQTDCLALITGISHHAHLERTSKAVTEMWCLSYPGACQALPGNWDLYCSPTLAELAHPRGMSTALME